MCSSCLFATTRARKIGHSSYEPLILLLLIHISLTVETFRKAHEPIFRMYCNFVCAPLFTLHFPQLLGALYSFITLMLYLLAHYAAASFHTKGNSNWIEVTFTRREEDKWYELNVCVWQKLNYHHESWHCSLAKRQLLSVVKYQEWESRNKWKFVFVRVRTHELFLSSLKGKVAGKRIIESILHLVDGGWILHFAHDGNFRAIPIPPSQMLIILNTK